MRRKHLQLIIVVLVILVIWLAGCCISQNRKLKELEANQPPKIATVATPTPRSSISVKPNEPQDECMECNKLTQNLEKANEQIAKLADDVNAYQVVIMELQNAINSKPEENEKEENSEYVTKLENQLADANAEIEKLKAKLDSSSKTDNEQVDELEKKLKTANAEIENLKKDKKSLNSKIDELETSNKKLKEERDTAKEDSKIYQNSLNDAETEKKNLQNQLDEAKKSITKLTTQLDTSNNSVTELNIELENEKKKVSNMELKIRAIENGIYETYLSLKFPFDGNTYMLSKDTTLYLDPTCTVEIKKFYDLSFCSSAIDKAEAANSLAVYVLRLSNGEFCYVPQNIGKPRLVTEDEFWNLYGENPEKFEWLYWEESWLDK